MNRLFPCILLSLVACSAGITSAEEDEDEFGGFSSSNQDADADSDADSDADADSDSDADADDGSSSPSADDDGDGFTNAEEESAGTNPDYEYSRPYEGGYNVGWCDSPPNPTGPTGTARVDSGGEVYEWPTLRNGDVSSNFQLMDQYGEMVDLYSFCGKHVMITVSAGWCAPCRALAEDMQSLQDRYRADDLQIIEIIMQDNTGGTPSQSFLSGWASEYGFDDIPVLQLTEPTSYDHPYFWLESDGYIPSIYHLDASMRVLSADGGVHDPGSWL
ncbi:MAG: redoxin domain-containing protein [Myxococcota bacterium]